MINVNLKSWYGIILSRRWLKWLWLTPVILLLTGLLVPAILIFSMRWLDPVSSAFMLQRHYDLWQDRGSETLRYNWVAAENISPKMMLAVVAAEDQKFPVHFGFDLEAIEKAMNHNRNNKKIRGASTISQQVAKNLFLWPSRSWVRKGMEVYFTGLIEIFWTKQRILEVYVNIVQFEANVFGVGAASKKFFNKTPEQLTAYETALLAAVLPNPKKYYVARPSNYVMTRARWIQQQMAGLGEDYVITGIVSARQYQANVPTTDTDGVVAADLPDEPLLEEPIDESMYDASLADELPAADLPEIAATPDAELVLPGDAAVTELSSDEAAIEVLAIP